MTDNNDILGTGIQCYGSFATKTAREMAGKKMSLIDSTNDDLPDQMVTGSFDASREVPVIYAPVSKTRLC